MSARNARGGRSILGASVEARPQFFDIDPMGVVWHGNYPRFLELGRVAVLDRINYGYAAMAASGFAWPVVDMGIKYPHPIALGQAITIDAAIVEWENRLKLDFEIRDTATGKRLTHAYSVHVAVDIATRQMLWETPPILREKLRPWL
ncbi:MAG: acyl-CoA thioesterase [Alphaproteobacteria bacterium]|nr:acyl-CoA thioesterase [Alphaproteobacteria bacterium]